MPFSYQPFWDLLAAQAITKKKFMSATGISKSTLDRMAKNELVSMDILDRICSHFHCDLSHIVEHTEAETEEGARFLPVNKIYCGDAAKLLDLVAPDSIAVSIWSPPYHVGKNYEAGQSYEEWLAMLDEVIQGHYHALKPGGFLAVNIGDILVFPDPNMPRIQASNVSLRKCSVTREDVLRALEEHPGYSRNQLAKLLGCSEQTIDRRLHGNNIRGGKYSTQTRLKVVGGLLEDMALRAGLYPYDRRIWIKDPAWANCNWTSNSYRSVDEFEYIYIFWKPGITEVDRARLSPADWAEWGSRAIWNIPSVRRNDIHEAMFPVELPRRLIQLLSEPGDTILDCFMGSGTTAIAALTLGRNYLGIDKEEQYVALARQRIAEEADQLRIPGL